MASTVNTFYFQFLLLILISLSLQPHARESKFFTKFTRYLSNAPTILLSPAPAPTPVLVPVAEPILAPAPAPAEEENGYGLYGHGSSEFSSEELYTTNETPEKKKESLGADEYKSETDTPFEKLLSRESYFTNNNGYSSNNGNGYSSSVNVNNGYNNNNENGYDGYNQNMYGNNGYKNNDNGFSNPMNENNGYKTNSYNQMNYNNDNKYSSSMNQYNGYNNDGDTDISFENEKNGYNGNGYTSPEEENSGYNSNNGYVMEQQGLSDTRFLENGKYSYDANNNENDHETSYEEEASDNGEGYYRNTEDSNMNLTP